MTPEEFKSLNSVSETVRVISVSDLTIHAARTLILGYTCERRDWHVYIYKRKLHLYIYGLGWDSSDASHYESGLSLPLEGIVPTKRIIPEACDYEFCRRLIEKGVNLPWTTYGAPITTTQKFHGEIYREGI